MESTSIDKCASCGKEGNSDNMNACNKCKMVKYCNAACKKKHRTKHKKACERRVAELHDEALFRDPPPREECPICFLTLPLDNQSIFQSCCGQRICEGCIYAMLDSGGDKNICAFCRTPNTKTNKEGVKQMKNQMKTGNGEAYNVFARFYADGDHGMPQDWAKANELWLKAGELGCADGYYNSGICHGQGLGVVRDIKKAKYYHELAAIGGCVEARHYLGVVEAEAGNYHRAFKHFLIAAKAGKQDSLYMVKSGFRDGIVTKDEYANTLRQYHEQYNEMKSNMRDKAATRVPAAWRLE